MNALSQNMQQDSIPVQRKLTFAKKLSDPILPSTRPQQAPETTPSSRKSARIANKGKTTLTMEEQATALLMKKTGFLKGNKAPDSATQLKFSTQFVFNLLHGQESRAARVSAHYRGGELVRRGSITFPACKDEAAPAGYQAPQAQPSDAPQNTWRPKP